MGRRPKVKFKVYEQVEIESAGAEGNAVARVDGKVMFVKYAAPGDVVDLQVIQKKKNYMEGRIIKFHSQSPMRITPTCSHFGVCGGCKWQHLPYPEQLKIKQQQVIDALQRIGKLDNFEVLPILGSAQEFGYRNKLDLSFSDRAWTLLPPSEGTVRPKALGFHVPGRFDRVLDVDKCYLMPELVNRLHRSVKSYCEDHGLSFFDPVTQEGLMRNLLVRCNRDGGWMVLLSFKERDEQAINGLMNHVKAEFPEIVSLLFVVNGKRNDTMADLEVECFAGMPYLTERLGDLTYTIRPQSFFQTNTLQAEVLYNITKDFAGLTGKELVYDLYTGTGSIALFVADGAREVVGIEYVEEAIADAKENMKQNGISHCKFYAGDMKDILTQDFIAIHGKPDVVITDPPRDGMHPSVVARLLETEPNKIVYVSCNPATQARDAVLLSEKYDLVKIQPVDMFPHTHHVENVGLWVIRK